MIQSREDLKYYLEQDAKMLDRPAKKPRFIHDDMWTYQILMRKCEYYINCKHDPISRVWLKWLKFRYSRIARIRGFEIPFNTFGPGLAIAHCGSIVVNANARIGKNCRIHEGTTIGSNGYGSTEAPYIGDNVFIATGAKVIGGVRIADNVVIGANTVVVKDIAEPGTTWGGVPARKISNKGSDNYLVQDDRDREQA